MPQFERGGKHYTTATKAVNHGDPAIENGIPGQALKQAIPGAASGAGTPYTQIGIGEKFVIQYKGVVIVTDPGLSSPAVGDLVYIIAATNVITKTASGNVKFGVITRLGGTRGLASGKLAIDLDLAAKF